MAHDFTKAVGYRTFGPRWPLQMYSTGNQRRIVWWCATDEAKAIPNPHKRLDAPVPFGARMSAQEYRKIVSADPDAMQFYREMSEAFAGGGKLDVTGFEEI